MTVLTPAAWWRGLGGLTRTGSALEGLAWARTLGQGAYQVAVAFLLGLLIVGILVLRGVPEA